MQETTSEEIRTFMGLHLLSGTSVSNTALAHLIRLCVSRWGVCHRSDVRSYIYGILNALYLNNEQNRACFNDTLNNLIVIGDIQEASLSQLEYINWQHQNIALEPINKKDLDENTKTALLTQKKVLLANQPTIVRCGDDAFQIGCTPVESPPPAPLNTNNELKDLIRWCASPLEEGGSTITLRAWLNRLRYQTSDIERLSDLWEAHTHTFSGSILDPNGVMVIAGTPGAFWGSLKNRTQGARIQSFNTQLPNGWYCGWRTGHVDAQWIPCFISHQSQLLAEDLKDRETLLWLKLAQSQAAGQKEQVRLDDCIIERTTELPSQIFNLLNALSVENPDWKTFRFATPEQAQSIAHLLRDHCGIEIV